jgi:hypothetical protein
MNFKSKSDKYWKIELIDYEEDIHRFHVKVLNYDFNDSKKIETFQRQKTTKSIDSVLFENLDWQKLCPLLKSFSPEVPFNLDSYKIPEEVYKIKRQSEIPILVRPKEKSINSFSVDFQIKFTKATFINGAVKFTKFIKEAGTQIDFEIKNPYIRSEFDNIKFWFAKKLNTGKFSVSGTISLIDQRVTEVIISSPEIDMITPNIIESVKIDRTIALTKPPKSIDPNKSIYSIEEIFKLIDPSIEEWNIFYQTETGIVESLTHMYDVRNKMQLKYLSQHLQTLNSKIHYTLSPLFGFLFLCEKSNKYHFIWELLKSHATYIWSIEITNENIKSYYSKIEKNINEVKLIGRDQYKKIYTNRILSSGFTFKVIDHYDININLDNGFIKWKLKLEEIIN